MKLVEKDHPLQPRNRSHALIEDFDDSSDSPSTSAVRCNPRNSSQVVIEEVNGPISDDQMQIVDFDGNFCSDFQNYIRRLKLDQCHLKFNVVAVLGCQSSGKSALLNSLFGTTFPEMNSKRGRQQTTEGIWASKNDKSNALVIDIEGTDSAERGGNGLTFEHRAALFSLAVADAVILNMWYHDIGRYQASNYGLLETVFAVNLKLFPHTREATKTTLIVVIRDYPATQTPFECLVARLKTDLATIWHNIEKPANQQDSKLTDFFNFRVVGMPSKLSETDAYDKEVGELRDTWNKHKPACYSREVPADQFAMYTEGVWNTIMHCSELNIPSQKEMLVAHRAQKEALDRAQKEALDRAQKEALDRAQKEALDRAQKEAQNRRNTLALCARAGLLVAGTAAIGFAPPIALAAAGTAEAVAAAGAFAGVIGGGFWMHFAGERLFPD